jgi:hypothetical protein
MNEERTGDYCPHSETGEMPVVTPFVLSDVMSMFQQAEIHHETGRSGCALALLKVIDRCATILPYGFVELRASVHARIGIS